MCSALGDACHEMRRLLPSTAVLIIPSPDQEVNKLIFLSEWREFPLAPCLARGKKLDDSSCLDVVEIARVLDMLPGRVKDLSAPRYRGLWNSVRIPIRSRG